MGGVGGTQPSLGRPAPYARAAAGDLWITRPWNVTWLSTTGGPSAATEVGVSPHRARTDPRGAGNGPDLIGHVLGTKLTGVGKTKPPALVGGGFKGWA